MPSQLIEEMSLEEVSREIDSFASLEDLSKRLSGEPTAEEIAQVEEAVKPKVGRIGDYLVSQGLVEREAVEAAVRESKVSGERIGNILVRNGFLRHADLIDAILTIAPDNIAFEKNFTARIPRDLLEQYSIVVIADTNDEVFIATLSPQEAVHAIAKHYYPNKEVRFVGLSPADLASFMESIGREGEDQDADDAEDDALVLDMILKQALLIGASDIHIEPRYRSYTVFYRHLGIRKIAHEGSLEQFAIIAAQVKDRARMDQVETRIPQDGSFSMEFRNRIVDMRVATVPTVNGEIVVIRMLDPDKGMKTLVELGISEVEAWRGATNYPFGLCLICGATGSGKTTTLNATVREMDRFGKSIRTVEDPVEYRIPYVGQVSINPLVGLDFTMALRAFMRADPDVIILGEVRDTNTAALMMRAAETGHLVLATLHTGSVRGAIGRLRGLEVAESDIRPLLRGVLVQRLVRTVCTACQGQGCQACMDTGYAGRTIVSECVMLKNELEVDRAMAGERWWPSMVTDALIKIRKGITTTEEIYRVFQAEIENQDEDLDGIEELIAAVQGFKEEKRQKLMSSQRQIKQEIARQEQVRDEQRRLIQEDRSRMVNSDVTMYTAVLAKNG